VTVTTRRSGGATVDTVTHQVVAFEDETDAAKDAIAQAEAYVKNRS
jgi:hypothetical protein